MGFLDSIVAAKQNGAIYGHSISPNRELVALGVSNIAGSFIPGTLPAYGSITRSMSQTACLIDLCLHVYLFCRSRVNGDVGARTQMASLICAGLVLLATFFLLPWMYYLPKAVLAAV
jgi:MFS superfamily sulfate permease-like transporter